MFEYVKIEYVCVTILYILIIKTYKYIKRKARDKCLKVKHYPKF